MKRVNNIFTGSIDGVTAYKKYGQIGRLDRKVTSLKERIDNIEELLDSDNFFEGYFENHYDPIIGQDSALSDENNVSQMLSSMADYLINSEESKQMNEEEKTHYVFSEDIDNKKEVYRQNNNDYVNSDNVEIVSKPVKPVEFKSQDIVVNKRDMIYHGEMSRILLEYSSFIGLIKSQIEKNVSLKRKYNSMIGLVKDDMKMVKESYLGIFPRSKSVPGGHYIKPVPSPDYHQTPIFKKMYNSAPSSVEANYEMWENSFDFTYILEHADITQMERDIINLKRLGWSFSEIIEDLNLNSYYKQQNTYVYVAVHLMKKINQQVVKFVDEREAEVWKHQKVAVIEEED